MVLEWFRGDGMGGKGKKKILLRHRRVRYSRKIIGEGYFNVVWPIHITMESNFEDKLLEHYFIGRY